jgi:hypothetical protein
MDRLSWKSVRPPAGKRIFILGFAIRQKFDKYQTQILRHRIQTAAFYYL